MIDKKEITNKVFEINSEIRALRCQRDDSRARFEATNVMIGKQIDSLERIAQDLENIVKKSEVPNAK